VGRAVPPKLGEEAIGGGDAAEKGGGTRAEDEELEGESEE